MTGLTLFSKPEWIDVNFGNSFTVSLGLLGNNIIYSQGLGYVTPHDILNFALLIKKIKTECDLDERSYIRIEDWTNITGTSRKAREEYIQFLRSSEQPEALILFGLSPMFRAGVNLGKRIYRLNYDIEIASDYYEAVSQALNILTKSQITFDNFNENANVPLRSVTDKNSIIQKVITQPDWRYQSDGFSMQSEILNGKILHIVSTGKFKEEDVEPIFRVLKNIAETLNFKTHPYYAVLCLQDSRGTKQRARISYYRAIKKLYQRFPFKMTILYGVNRFLKTAINFNRHFLPIKVQITNDLDDAISFVDGNKRESKKTGPESTEKPIGIISNDSDQIEHYVDELLQYIEKINWEKDDLDQNTNIDPSHPFSRVFDAISLVKWELDDLIFERTRTEEELKKAKERAESANLAKSEFLANMSHELRTPLNHILGFTELVVDGHVGELNDTQKEYLTDVHNSSAHLLSLIDDILDISKVEAGKLEINLSTVAIREILENSLLIVQEKALKHGIHFSSELNGIPEIIKADERKLKQIQYNLLSNAVKFTQNGGDVKLHARIIEVGKGIDLDHLDIDTNCRNWIHISITDTGIGLLEEDLDRIFKPFEQVEHSKSRQYQGTGLGLSLTKTLVELHGGIIWAESEGIGKGCKFNYILPLQV